MRTIPVGPSGLRIIEALLTLLEEAGVDPATAAWAVDILALYVTGGAVEQSLRRDLPDPLASITEVFGTLSPAQYPRIHAARAELVSGAGTERFMWAVSVLVDGILHNPRGEVPSAPARRRRPPAR